MKKNIISSLVLAAVAFAAISPAGAFGYEVSPKLKESAMAALKRAKAAIPDQEYWKDKTVRKAKRMWFCFTNKSKCSISEVDQARAWIIGVPTSIALALLAVGGIVVRKNQMNSAKSQAMVSSEGVDNPQDKIDTLGDFIANKNSVTDLVNITRAQRVQLIQQFIDTGFMGDLTKEVSAEFLNNNFNEAALRAQIIRARGAAQ